MWNVVPDIYNVATSAHIQSSVFNWTYLQPYWRYLDKSMRVILQTWSHIQRTSSSLYYVDCGPGHIQWNDNTGYSVFNIQQNVFALLLGDISTIQWALYCNLGAKYRARIPVYVMSAVVPDIYNVITVTYIQASKFKWTYMRCYWKYPDISVCVILPTWCQIQRTPSSLRYLNCGPRYIECNYTSAYSGVNNQLSVSALLLEICRQFNAPYTAILVPNTAHILQFTLSELWTRPYTA
jgi:hypothetical protein